MQLKKVNKSRDFLKRVAFLKIKTGQSCLLKKRSAFTQTCSKYRYLKTAEFVCYSEVPAFKRYKYTNI